MLSCLLLFHKNTTPATHNQDSQFSQETFDKGRVYCRDSGEKRLYITSDKTFKEYVPNVGKHYT